MAYPYDYDCGCGFNNEKGFKGRQSEVLFNGERHDVFEAVKHLIDYPKSAKATPVAKHRGALWLDQRTNQLYVWVGPGFKHERVRNGWLPVFADKFQIFDEMMNDVPSSNPVVGQLWLYNGTLMYFDGSSWQPVKTLEQSDSQFNISAFSDFQIYAPLNRVGSAVVSDLELEAQLEMQRRYQNADPDLRTVLPVEISKRWNFGDEAVAQDVIDFDLNDVSYQYLVPNMDVDRVFIDGKLDNNYIRQSKSVIQYKRSYLLDEDGYSDNTPAISHIKKPSLIHTNPGKLSNIRKRIFKIDRTNPKIMCPAYNTEFYGFKVGDIHGRFLVPTKTVDEASCEYKKLLNMTNEKNKEALQKKLEELGYSIDGLNAGDMRIESGDYEKQTDGIYLSHEATNNYDYVLAITHEFSWLNATGQLRQGDNRNGSSSYYVPQRLGSVNIFVNGFDYEDTYYTWDHKNETVTLADDVSSSKNMDVAVLGVFAHEYGFIRDMNIAADNKSARISTIHRFLKPLIFVNGEVLNRSQWQYYDRNLMAETDKPGTSFILYGIHRDMCWTVIDMQKETVNYDKNGAAISSEIEDICIEDDGMVDKTDEFIDSFGQRAIPLPSDYSVKYEDSDTYRYKRPHIVLFVNGLMVKREDVYYDKTSHTITCEGLEPGMTYVILDDTSRQLYTEDMEDGIMPSLSVGKIDASIVYHDGFIINEPSSYRYEGSEGFAATSALHGEIRAFRNATEWKIFNADKRDDRKGIPGVWEKAEKGISSDVISFSNTYSNGATSISIAKNLSELRNGELTIFGFKLANYIESPLTPVTCWLHKNNSGKTFIKDAGYADEYIELVKNASDDSVYINKIDPSNPDIMSRYKERNDMYYVFCFKAFDLWCEERDMRSTGKTLKELIAEYKEDSKKHVDEYSQYLKGYFYDGVYMRTKSDEYTYVDLRDYARGTPWANKAFIGKNFNPESDYVMVWLNGVRQYPEKNYVIEPEFVGDILKGYNIIFGHYEGDTLVESVDDRGYTPVPVGKGHYTDTTAEEPICGMLTYIIQKPESGATKACRYIVLDNNNCINGSHNVYTTKDLKPEYIDTETFMRDTSHDFSLFPGNVTVYADGIRLPRGAYTVLDNYTIVINSDKQFIGSKDSYPEHKYIDAYGNVKVHRHLRPEELLVEVRQESRWTERTIETDQSFNGDIYVLSDNSQLPVTILDTQDTILMFVDGLYHGLTQNDGYVIDKTLGAISIRDATVLNAMLKDDIETYLSLHPEYIGMLPKEIAAYRTRKKKGHNLTIEWR